MDREKFLQELGFLLQDISDEDREDALTYYTDYFLEAGKENEVKVLHELQSPERVAALIKAGLDSQFEEAIEYSESSMGNSQYDRQHKVLVPEYEEKKEQKTNTEESENNKQRFKGNRDRNRILLSAILISGLFIVGMPVFGVGFGFFITVLILLFSLGIVFGTLGVTSAVVAVITFGHSLLFFPKYPGASLIGIGVACLLSAIAIFMFNNVRWPFQIIPKVTKSIVAVVRDIFHKVGDKL